MATINLSWTPAGSATSVSQTVQRKPNSSSTWTDLATGLGASVSTYADSTASDNILYDYRILNVCSVGGPTPGSVAQADNIVCPAVSASNPQTGEQDVISWTVGATSGSVSITNVLIIKNGNVVNTTVVNSQAGASGTYDTGQDYGATYTVRAVLSDGVFSKNCETTITIGSAPACGAPSNLTATPA